MKKGLVASLFSLMLLAVTLSGCMGIGGDGGLFGEEESREPLRINHIQMDGLSLRTTCPSPRPVNRTPPPRSMWH